MSCGRLVAILGAVVLLLPGLCFFAFASARLPGTNRGSMIFISLVFFCLSGVLAYVGIKMERKPDVHERDTVVTIRRPPQEPEQPQEPERPPKAE